jgi:replicative DNA helicase
VIDAALEKGLPANIEAEGFIVGSLLKGEDYGLIRGSLEPDAFSTDRNRRIYERMGEIHERGERIDVIGVSNELEKYSQLGPNDLSYLCGLCDLPVIVNLEGWVRIVQEKSMLRHGALACNAMMQRFLLASESPGELLADAERMVRDLSAQTATKGNLQSMSEIVDAIDLNSIGKVPANLVRTPYAPLNRVLAGMFCGELHVVGARPSAGKSVQALETALCAAKSGHQVAFFSLEMTKQAITSRAACNMGQVDNSSVRYGRMNEAERYAYARALKEIRELPIFIDDRAHTFAAMVQGIRRMKDKPRLVIVDHLHLMRSVGRHENRNNELATITRDMKLLAGEMDLTVLLLAQLNRESEKLGRRPEMRDLRECGSIEADADVITFLHRKEVMAAGGDKGPVPVEMFLAKQREGVSFVRMPMMLIGKYYKFVEMSDEEER